MEVSNSGRGALERPQVGCCAKITSMGYTKTALPQGKAHLGPGRICLYTLEDRRQKGPNGRLMADSE
jgi:hypothetical protein